MINFDFEENCCGCGSCYNACPVNAISMKPNAEGFLMPIIDNDKCINCSKCDKVCPYLNTKVDYSKFSLDDFKGLNTYLYYSQKKERIDSASGGFVFDLSLLVSQKGGLVCGCVWNEKLEATHIISNELKDLKRMQSSKYVQSNLKNCFIEIKKQLKNGNTVLFCGTPCQTASLKQFLGNNPTNENLISVSIMCHGVPSPLIWEKYKYCLEKKLQGKLINVNMRDKKEKGYAQSHVCYQYIKEGAIKTLTWPTYLQDPYIYLFTDDLFLRNSCSHCPYKSTNSGADIIAGDFHSSTEGANNMGCSSLIVLTQKGDSIIKQLIGTLKKSTIEEIGSVNPMVFRSTSLNRKRKEIFFKKMANYKEGDIRFLTNFLPTKFYIKMYLNKMGVFNFIRKILKSLKS
jgi:coenzyme F420-reducing hydrogenase beta subunit